MEGRQPPLYTRRVEAYTPPTLSPFWLLLAGSAFFINLHRLDSALANVYRLRPPPAGFHRSPPPRAPVGRDTTGFHRLPPPHAPVGRDMWDVVGTSESPEMGRWKSTGTSCMSATSISYAQWLSGLNPLLSWKPGYCVSSKTSNHHSSTGLQRRKQHTEPSTMLSTSRKRPSLAEIQSMYHERLRSPLCSGTVIRCLG